jgi:hypothetical protein
MTDQTWRGSWWIAGEEVDAQPGTLTISPFGEIKLDLVGGFDLSIRTPLEGGYSISALDRRPPLVYGLCAEMKITLVDCQTIHMSGAIFGTPQHHELTASRALVGTHLSDVDSAEFAQVQLQIENLFPWLQINSLEQRIDIDGECASAHILKSSPLTAKVDEWEIEAWVWSKGFHFEYERNSASVIGEVEAYLTIRPSRPVSYRGFDDVSKALMDLITLASGEASGIISSTLIHVETTEVRVGPEPKDVRDMPISVQSFGQHVHKAKPDAAPQSSRNFRFTCASSSFQELVERWIPLRLSALGGCNVRFGLDYARPGFTETRLLSIAIAAEAFHRDLYGDSSRMPEAQYRLLKRTLLAALIDSEERDWLASHLHNDGDTYRSRILALARSPLESATSVIIDDRDQWADDLVKARNGLAHTAGAQAGTFDIFLLTEQTIFLIDLVLMHELGLSGDVLTAAANGNEFLASLRRDR